MAKLLPIDLVKKEGQWSVVCINVESFLPSLPFFIDDLYVKFPEIFTGDLERSDDAFVRQMYYSDDPRINYITVEDFLKQYSDATSHKKLGFIFHMSRCGSTLFSNLTRNIDRLATYSEPTIVNAILDPRKEITLEFKSKLLKASIYSLANFQDSNVDTIFIKFRSWNVLFLDQIMDIFADVPSLFIHRNGLEVASSLRNKPSGWVRARNLYIDFFSKVLKVNIESTTKMSQLEYTLSMLGEFVKRVLSCKKGSIVSLDYINLKKDFFLVMKSVFKINITDNEMGTIVDQMRIYSKNAGLEFTEDGKKKQENYTPFEVKLSESLVEILRSKLITVN